MTTKYVARLNGQIVGKRTTKSRAYTHAVVVRWDEQLDRDRAYNYVSTSTDLKNYEYYVRIAEGRSPHQHSQEVVVDASVQIDGGFNAYVERVRQRAIAWFEKDRAKGHYEPHVLTWCGREDLARTQLSRIVGSGRVADAWIVPAERA